MVHTTTTDQRDIDEFNDRLSEYRVDTLVDGIPIDFSFGGVIFTIFIDGPDTFRITAEARWTELAWLFAKEVRIVRYPDGHRPVPGPSRLLIPARTEDGPQGLTAQLPFPRSSWGSCNLKIESN